MKTYKLENKNLKGTINIPSSKSYTHRAIIAAALSKGVSKIRNVSLSNDINMTIDAMKNLGSMIEKKEDYYEIDGTKFFNENKENRLKTSVECHESGSTLRFLIPISLAKNVDVTITGTKRLGERPLDPFFEIFKKQNIEYSFENNENLNLNIKGKLAPDDFSIDGTISSQFITGLLFTLPLLEKESHIDIINDLESKAYVDLTINILEMFGIEIENIGYKKFIIRGNQQYKAYDYSIEGDYSQGAFFLVANSLGNNLDIRGLAANSLQGDSKVIDIIKLLENKKEEETLVIDGKDVPDIIPILALRASLTKGKTIFKNIGRLRIKECDRLSATSKELNKLGANIKELEDSMEIVGVESLHGGNVSSWNDHRIAMMLAIASTRAKGEVIIEDTECVKKSYPDFWKDFLNVGGEIIEL